jgi:hypothetical protein
MIPIVNKIPTLLLGRDLSHGSSCLSDIPSSARVRFFYLRIICIKLRYNILYPLSTLISSCTINIVEVYVAREDMKSHS